MLDSIVDYGFNLVVSDVDVVWFRDPTELLDRFPRAGERGLAGLCSPCPSLLREVSY